MSPSLYMLAALTQWRLQGVNGGWERSRSSWQACFGKHPRTLWVHFADGFLVPRYQSYLETEGRLYPHP